MGSAIESGSLVSQGYTNFGSGLVSKGLYKEGAEFWTGFKKSRMPIGRIGIFPNRYQG